jgi:hypothetical protein
MYLFECPRFHDHEFVFRSAVDGALINFWRADGALGWFEVVKVSREVKVTLVNYRPERVFVTANSRDTSGQAGLNPYDGNPLNQDELTLGVLDQDRVVIMAEDGEVLQSFTVDAPRGGNRQRLLIQPLSEHVGEL